MTITRLAQFTAETRVLTDLTFLSSGSNPTISSTQAKTGTYSYALVNGQAAFGKATTVPQGAVRMGYWMYLSSLSTNGETCIYWAGNGRTSPETANKIMLFYDGALGEIRVERPNDASNYEILDTFAIPSSFLTTGSWFHVGIDHYMHASDGWLSLYVNGILIGKHEGDTRPSHWTGSAKAYETSVVRFCGPGAFSSSGNNGFVGAFVDDMVLDSIVGEVDAPVPSRRFLMVLPTAAGADAAWTPVPVVANYLNVDENPNDGDATYNKALAANLRDTYAMGDIVLPVDHRIVAVIPSPFVKRLDSEIQHLLSVHAWDGLTYLDSADLDLSMSYDVPVFARFTTQPDLSDWNETDFNAMQFGVRSRGTF